MQAEHKSGAVPDSLKILAVGNSFSQDCMRYLWDLLRRGGIRSVTLGNLYEPGCSLARHLELATGGAPVRTYEKNTTGEWEIRDGICLREGIADEDWDFITFQQTSRTSGLAESYGETLTRLLDVTQALDPRAKFVWT